MHFQHSGEIWHDFPELVPGIVVADGITPGVSLGDRAAKFTTIASSRLADRAESELPEIWAWRRAFARMGLKPTQYRGASESLLRSEEHTSQLSLTNLLYRLLPEKKQPIP